MASSVRLFDCSSWLELSPCFDVREADAVEEGDEGLLEFELGELELGVLLELLEGLDEPLVPEAGLDCGDD